MEHKNETFETTRPSENDGQVDNEQSRQPNSIYESEVFDIGDLSWNGIDSSTKSIKIVYKYVLTKAKETARWYFEKRTSRRRISKLVRIISIVLGTTGGLVPLLQPLWNSLPSNLGYILIGLSAVLLFTNRFLGVSSGWIRFVQTELQIQKTIESFQLEWAQALASMSGKPSNPVQLSQLFEKMRRFVSEINQLVEQETNAWAVQFDQDLGLVDKSTDGRLAANPNK